MRILEGAITEHAAEGRLTLQVPESWLGTGEPPNQVELPDEWFVFLKNGRPVVGREEGFLFLTRKGFEANKEALQAAFNSRQDRGHTWEEFVANAEADFQARLMKISKLKDNLSAKLKDCEAYIQEKETENYPLD